MVCGALGFENSQPRKSFEINFYFLCCKYLLQHDNMKETWVTGCKIDLFYHSTTTKYGFYHRQSPHTRIKESWNSLKQRQFKQVDEKKLFRWFRKYRTHCILHVDNTARADVAVVVVFQFARLHTDKHKHTIRWLKFLSFGWSLDEQSFVNANTHALKHKHSLIHTRFRNLFFCFFLKRMKRDVKIWLLFCSVFYQSHDRISHMREYRRFYSLAGMAKTRTTLFVFFSVTARRCRTSLSFYPIALW